MEISVRYFLRSWRSAILQLTIIIHLSLHNPDMMPSLRVILTEFTDEPCLAENYDDGGYPMVKNSRF